MPFQAKPSASTATRCIWPFHSRPSTVPGLRSAVRPAQVHGALSGVLGRPRAIEQALALAIQVTQLIGLKPVSQNAKQEMAGQVRGRSPPEYGVPTGPKLTDVEITQARNLDVECLSVRQGRTDLDARHDAQDDRRLDWRAPDLPLSRARDLVDPVAVHLLRAELQLEALAHHAGKEAAHRVLLPARCLHHRGNRCPGG